MAAPRPDRDQSNEFYWADLSKHRLSLQCCKNCGRRRFPPMPSCPFCAGTETAIEHASGQGALYSWIVVHRAFDPSFAEQAPYTLGCVDLDGGGRLVARIEGIDAPAAGMIVKARFHDHGDWTEPRFIRAD